MSSTAKALSLLSHFSSVRPEIGLSQMCRIAGRDKATTYRHLQALETAGFIEQNPATKHYRLGPAVMQLAHIREATVPRTEGAKPVIRALADATGETAHVTVLSGHTLFALCEHESPHHGIRAVIDLNSFPLHATASGLCALAFGPADLMQVAAADLHGFTPRTANDEQTLQKAIGRIRRSGFGRADGTYEVDVQGLSAPLFDHTGHFAGAVAVACVASRFHPDLARTILSELVIAARDITHNWGGTIPAPIEAAWSATLSQSNILEPMS